jgi:hypothetical protein
MLSLLQLIVRWGSLWKEKSICFHSERKPPNFRAMSALRSHGNAGGRPAKVIIVRGNAICEDFLVAVGDRDWRSFGLACSLRRSCCGVRVVCVRGGRASQDRAFGRCRLICGVLAVRRMAWISRQYRGFGWRVCGNSLESVGGVGRQDWVQRVYVLFGSQHLRCVGIAA